MAREHINNLGDASRVSDACGASPPSHAGDPA
jgi:hypothetical protein